MYEIKAFRRMKLKIGFQYWYLLQYAKIWHFYCSWGTLSAVNLTLGSYGLRKVTSMLWNGKAKNYPLYSVYVCKLLAWQNLKGIIISIIGAPNTVEVLSACFYLYTKHKYKRKSPRFLLSMTFLFRTFFFYQSLYPYFFSLSDKVGNSSTALS